LQERVLTKLEVRMSSNLSRIVALVAVVVLGLYVVSQSGGQDPFKEVQRGEKDKTLVAIPNAVATPRVQWQYKVESRNMFDVDVANDLGERGWELVTIYRQNDSSIRAVFKRPKQEL